MLVAAKREAWRVLRGQSRQTPAEIEEDAVATPDSQLPENVTSLARVNVSPVELT